MGTLGVILIDKEENLSKIKTGVFGSLSRKLKIENLDQSGKITSVKLRSESTENDFTSYNSLVLNTDDQWKIINNLAVVQAKSR